MQFKFLISSFLAWRIKSEDSLPEKESAKQTESRTRQGLGAAGENNSLKVKNRECVVHCRDCLPDLLFLFWGPDAKGSAELLSGSGWKQLTVVKWALRASWEASPNAEVPKCCKWRNREIGKIVWSKEIDFFQRSSSDQSAHRNSYSLQRKDQICGRGKHIYELFIIIFNLLLCVCSSSG